MLLLHRPRGFVGSVLATQRANLLAYWPMDDTSGTIARDASGNGRSGVYNGTPVLTVAGIGDGRTAMTCDASDDSLNITSTSLTTAFNGAEGSCVIWAKVSGAGVWTDGVLRRLITLQVDANNRYLLGKSTVNNTLQINANAGGTNKSITYLIPAPPTGWFSVGLSWSKAADQVIVYYNGVATAAPTTGIGTFTGSLSSATTYIGASSVISALWSGVLAHCAIWTTPLTATDFARLATLA